MSETENATAAPAEAKAGKGKKPPLTKKLIEVTIPPIKVKFLTLKLVGDEPLICHAWSEKSKKEILDKQMGKAQKKREHKDPEKEYEASLYILERDDLGNPKRYGFPAIAFKLAAVEACRFVDGITQTATYGAFHVVGEFVEIEGKPKMRKDMVRVGGKGPGTGVADIRFRGEFINWSVNVTVRYNSAVITDEQIANLFQIAGFSIGVGEWRPNKRGQHGLFSVAGSEVKQQESEAA